MEARPINARPSVLGKRGADDQTRQHLFSNLGLDQVPSAALACLQEAPIDERQFALWQTCWKLQKQVNEWIDG